MERFRARRSLGQCFLSYRPTAEALVEAVGIETGDTVLEIGPGKGVLTRLLVERARRVIAVEVDRRLVGCLAGTLGNPGNLETIHADFLSFELPGVSGLKVIGNLPFNISSQVLFRLLEALPRWDAAVLTTQREFARRLLAVPGSKAYAALSVFFERACTREKLFNIPASHFKPRPEVTSTAFRLARRPAPLFEVEDEETFRTVVKACFGQRRKTLANNLTSGLGIDKGEANRLLRGIGIDPGIRAEQVSGADFRLLAETVGRSRQPRASSSSR